MKMSEEINFGFYQELEKFKEYAKPLYKMKEGDNILTIKLNEGWETVKTRFGESVRIPVITEDNVESILLVRKNSRLYRTLMIELVRYIKSKDLNVDVVKVKITRYGTGVSTTYNVKVLEQEQPNEQPKEQAKKGGKK